MTKKKKFISVIIVILFALVGGGVVYAFGIINSMSAEDLNEANLSLNTDLDASGIVNIALFGIDGRDEEDQEGNRVEGDRTDTIMIASVNFDTGEVKVVSIMRDILAQLTETDMNDAYIDKINASYAFGGVEAAIRTLNENFDLNIRDYVIVNFNCMVDTVDAIGGVEVNVKNEDVLEWTNEYIGAVSVVVDGGSAPVPGTGIQDLNGIQALAYCRNRYSDSDYGRTARQREVITQIAQKFMASDLLTTMNVLRSVYPYITTSLSIREITSYAQAYLSLKEKAITTSRVPFDGINTTGEINELSYVIPTTLADNVKVLHYFLFGDSDYKPSDRVTNISNRIIAMSGHGSTVDWSVTTPKQIIDNMDLNASNETGVSTIQSDDTDSDTQEKNAE